MNFAVIDRFTSRGIFFPSVRLVTMSALHVPADCKPSTEAVPFFPSLQTQPWYFDRSRRLLKSPLDRPSKLFKAHILSHNHIPRLILLVQRNLHVASLNLPTTDLTHESLKSISFQIQPLLQNPPINTLHTLADDDRHAHAHQLLESLHVGDQVSVQIVAVECAPEVGIGRVCEERVQHCKFLDGFGERVRRWVGREGVWRQKREAEAEVW